MRKFKCIQASMFDGRVVRNGEIIETDTDLSNHVGFSEITPPAPSPAPDSPPPDENKGAPSNPPSMDGNGSNHGEKKPEGDTNPPAGSDKGSGKGLGRPKK